ncbi:MAG: hypothetical protein JXB26_20390 [Candidatus Aminicenantes bacterium]|nr:hypothetical protein [Candidatus Aminicenantes bacterium]
MILKSHLISMVIYAFFVSIVLAFIRRTTQKDRLKYFLFLFFSMTIGAILFGWFMFLFMK